MNENSLMWSEGDSGLLIKHVIQIGFHECDN